MASMELVLGMLANGKKLVWFSETGTDSYSSSGQDITIGSLRYIEKILMLSITGGYKVDVANATINSSQPNKITVHVYFYDYDASSDGAAVEVSDGTDLSSQTIYGLVIGW